jgi:hypothetical protein
LKGPPATDYVYQTPGINEQDISTVEKFEYENQKKIQIKFIPTSNPTTFSTNNICGG